MKIKNNGENDIAIGSTIVPRGATVDVKDWAEKKDSFAVKAMVEAGVLVPGSDDSVEDSPTTKTKTMQELDRMKVDYDKTKSAAELAALLAEAKAKGVKDGKVLS